MKNTINKGKTSNSSGITLIALVVTVIVLLILAGISIAMLSGDNGILKRATDAKENTGISQIQEQINLAYHSALVEGRGKVEKGTLETELTKEFPGSEISVTTDANDSSKWVVTVDGVSLTVPAGTGSTQAQVDPAVEYGYAENEGVVSATTLVKGDKIYYYYDANAQPIPFVVMYNNQNDGLQVISIDSVRDVILGYDDDDATKRDPKAIEAFANGAPLGYENNNFEKARWSYNHAIATLNGYAQEYLGAMAINARCPGTSEENIVLTEDDTNNMLITDGQYGHFTNYEGKFKNESINRTDFDALRSLGFIGNGGHMWWTARRIEEGSGYTPSGFALCDLNGNYARSICSIIAGRSADFSYWYEVTRYNNGYINGFRPIIKLKTSILVEKFGNIYDDRANEPEIIK